MRHPFFAVALGIGSLTLLASVPMSAQGCRPYDAYSNGPMAGSYYTPPAVSYYYSPAMPAYYFTPSPGYARPAYNFSSAPGYAPAPTYSPAAATVIDVGIYDNYFEPNTMTVAPGTTIRWMNRGQHHHTVTSGTGLFDSGELSHNGMYTVTFNQPGHYDYYCGVHPKEMRGTIVVGSGAAAGGAGSPGY